MRTRPMQAGAREHARTLPGVVANTTTELHVSLATAAPDATDAANSTVLVDAAAHRRRAALLLAFAAWNVLVWGNRLLNIFQTDQDYSVAFVAVHAVLFVVGLGGAAALAVVGLRMRRESRGAAS